MEAFEITEDPGTVLLVHKPLGLTSFDVTYHIKRLLQRRWRKFLPLDQAKKKKVKVGLMDFQKAEIIEGLSSSDKIYMPQ